MAWMWRTSPRHSSWATTIRHEPARRSPRCTASRTSARLSGSDNGPVGAVVAVLEVQRGRVPADRDADVVDGRDQVVQPCRLQRAGLDDLAPAAQVTALDAVGDHAAKALSVNDG